MSRFVLSITLDRIQSKWAIQSEANYEVMLNVTPFLNQITVQHLENKNFDAPKRGLVIKRTEERRKYLKWQYKTKNLTAPKQKSGKTSKKYHRREKNTVSWARHKWMEDGIITTFSCLQDAEGLFILSISIILCALTHVCVTVNKSVLKSSESLNRLRWNYAWLHRTKALKDILKYE